MSKPQYAILRFAKYKGPEISNIEAHNERTKEKYASNPDVDTARSHLNFHLVTPQRKYRAEAEKQIAEAGCRTRSDSAAPQTYWWPASPSSGGNFDAPNDENRGDNHYWDVWHGEKPFTEYRKFFFRYASEFGFQSFPCLNSYIAIKTSLMFCS